MGPDVVVISDILRNQKFEMPLVERNYVIKKFMSYDADKPFGDAVLPGAVRVILLDFILDDAKNC